MDKTGTVCVLQSNHPWVSVEILQAISEGQISYKPCMSLGSWCLIGTHRLDVVIDAHWWLLTINRRRSSVLSWRTGCLNSMAGLNWWVRSFNSWRIAASCTSCVVLMHVHLVGLHYLTVRACLSICYCSCVHRLIRWCSCWEKHFA